MNRFFTIITVLFLLLAAFALYQIIDFMSQYQHLRAEYTNLLNFEDRLLNASEWLSTSNESTIKQEDAAKLSRGASENYQAALQFASFFALLSIAYLAVITIRYMRTTQPYSYIVRALIIIAFGMFIAGVFAPMLEIAAFVKDLEIPLKKEIDIPFAGSFNIDLSKTFHGEMYFYYQNKSAIDLIKLLISSGNITVGLSILVFSILLPLFKLTYSWIQLSQISDSDNKIQQFIKQQLAKWSMADVFVAAVFLAFLSFNNMNTGIETQSKSLPGMYFFLAYCIISIFLSSFVHKAQKERA